MKEGMYVLSISFGLQYEQVPEKILKRVFLVS